MVWQRLLRWCRGYVRFRGEGGFPETFLSLAAANGLEVTDTKRQGETLYGWCPANQYKTLRAPAKTACMRLRIEKKAGLYFRLYPYRRRWGLPVGMVIGGLLISLLSGRIWVVQVEKENIDVSDTVILQAAAELGIYPGCSLDNVNMEELRLQAFQKLPDAVYVSVNPSGCVARVVVNGKDPTPSIQDFHQHFSNLVAKMDGKIVSTKIYSGQTVVQPGEGVTKGQLLVSGATQSDRGNTYLRRSFGTVTAETFHTLSATVKLRETHLLPKENPILRPYFRFLKWDIPLFDNSPLVFPYRTDVFHRLMKTDAITLPLGFVIHRVTPLAWAPVTYTPKQADFEAEKRVAAEKDRLVQQGVVIIEETERKFIRTEEGVTLSVTCRCEQDIATEIPLNILEVSGEKN